MVVWSAWLRRIGLGLLALRGVRPGVEVDVVLEFTWKYCVAFETVQMGESV